MITTKQLFIQFLKQNNAFEQFMFNFNNSRFHPKKSFTRYFETIDKYGAINNAFNWADSPEHFRFWKNMDTKWIIYARNNTL